MLDAKPVETRIGWDQYFLLIASAVSKRADCSRRQVGAVVVDTEKRIAATGYNGSYPGGPSCLKGDCPRGRHYPVESARNRWDATGLGTGQWSTYIVQECACRELWPCPHAVAPGSSYDTGLGACVAIHAEMNAILFADRERLKGATLYITDEPCEGCAKHIRSTPIKRVVWPEGEYENG